MTEMQKQFEEWAKSKGMSIDFDRHTGSDYDNVFVQCCWDGWQASRAAIAVKLPLFCVDGADAAEYRDDVIKSLGEAGVSYE